MIKVDTTEFATGKEGWRKLRTASCIEVERKKDHSLKHNYLQRDIVEMKGTISLSLITLKKKISERQTIIIIIIIIITIIIYYL